MGHGEGREGVRGRGGMWQVEGREGRREMETEGASRAIKQGLSKVGDRRRVRVEVQCEMRIRIHTKIVNVRIFAL